MFSEDTRRDDILEGDIKNSYLTNWRIGALYLLFIASLQFCFNLKLNLIQLYMGFLFTHIPCIY